MADFTIGSKVIELNSNRKGTIIGVDEPTRGGQTYQVLFAGSYSEETIDESFLQPSYDVSDPFERCKQKIYGGYSDFTRKNTSLKIENSSNNTISSLKASKTLFRTYQFKPLLKFLNSDNNRLLIADEVGLGKTIEAGHIMLEMKARNQLRNVLIICPKMLQEKWRNELKEKFNLGFTVYEKKTDAINALKIGDGAFRGIINYEKIQQDKKDKNFQDIKSLLGYINVRGVNFSMILCDEAHRIRNNNTQRYKGAVMLMRHAKSAVFLTATPVMIDEKNLYNLLHLLDENEYYDDGEFKNSLEINKPFIEALRKIRTSTPLPTIADELCSSEVVTTYKRNDISFNYTHVIEDLYANDPLFVRDINWMRKEKDTRMLRAKLQFDLTSMSAMSNIFSRTRKKDITTDWSQPVRRPSDISVILNQEERERYDEVIEQYINDNSYIDFWGDVKMSQGSALGLVTKKRQVASSVYGYLNDESDLEKGIDKYEGRDDAKVDRLIEIIQGIQEEGEEKLIVFALFKKTLKYLKIRLEKKGYRCAMIHGDIRNREGVLEHFKTNRDIHILLSSEVGSEGLDMQFCSSMVNYDLPWNPMVIEQRIGRIDRFGQKSPVVKIYNFVVADSIQEEIYDRLLKRIGIFRDSIGDLEAILDSDFKESGKSIMQVYTQLEKDLFANKLTKAERERKMEDIAQAIVAEKERINEIEKGLTNSLTNDSYFQSEIDRIKNNNKYVTEYELQNFIEMMMEEALPTCNMNPVGNKSFEIVLPKSSPHLLINFLNQYHPVGDDNNVQLNEFRNKIEGKTSFTITFDQETAFNDKTLIYVNMYHPLVQASLQYFNKKEEPYNKSFMFNLKRCSMPEGLNGSMYFLVIYEIIVHQIIYGVPKESSTLLPVLYDCDRGEAITDEDLAVSFWGKVQEDAEYIDLNSVKYPDASSIQEMKGDIVRYVGKYNSDKSEEIDIRIRSRREKKLKQMEENFAFVSGPLKKRIEEYESYIEQGYLINDQEMVSKYEALLPLVRGQLKSKEEDYEERKQELLRDPELSVRGDIVSVNLVNII